MIITLAAALSLAASLAIDVPYLPQTDALCGGAAAAMVFRYWGDAHADAQAFAPLVDRRAGGIANDVLANAIARRGWQTARAGGSLEALRARIGDRQPVIVLLPDRGALYHYVVVVAATDDTVIVHDPAWGPSRPIRASDFERAWKAAGFWSLVITPPQPSLALVADEPPPSLVSNPGELRRDELPPSLASNGDGLRRDCDARLSRALDEIAARGIEHADAWLAGVRAHCPGAAGPIRELAGVRFAQRRWSDAAALARDALRIDPRDEYA